jgi:hypothetical protein
MMGKAEEPGAVGRRAGVTGVHSLHRFVFSVPSLDEAETFYSTFGLDVRRDGNALEMRTFGNSHCWGSVHGNGAPKKLEYLSFGIFTEDLPRFSERVARLRDSQSDATRRDREQRSTA